MLIKYGYLPTRLVFTGDASKLGTAIQRRRRRSSHPVAHDRTSPLPQPSLLVNMTKYKWDSIAAAGRITDFLHRLPQQRRQPGIRRGWSSWPTWIELPSYIGTKLSDKPGDDSGRDGEQHLSNS